MRYDKGYAYFRPHTDWYTWVSGVGYVPTEKAPEDAVKAMEAYNKKIFEEKRTD